MQTLPAVFAFSLSLALGLAPLAGQEPAASGQPPTAPAPSLPAPSDQPPVPESETVVLSPFEVNSKADTGYLSQDTASGSRLDTKLADTPAAISVFTQEFINDIAATNVGDVAQYAVNTAEDFSFPGGSPNGNGYAGATGRILTTRGLPTSGGPATGRSVNFISYPMEIDTYNIDRVDFSRGPNSILFGLGPGGGVFNVASNTADPDRVFGSSTLRVGSWDDLRGTIDVNAPVVAQKAALRIDAVDEYTQSWRPWDYTDNKRIYGTLRFELTPSTTLDLEGEWVAENINRPRAYLGPDNISAWLNAGRPSVTGSVTNTTPTASGIRTDVTTDQWDYIDGGNTGATPLFLNVKDTARTSNPVLPVSQDPMVQNFSEIPKEAELAGPGLGNFFHMSDYTAILEQKFTPDLYMQATVNQTNFTANQKDINGPLLTLYYDPNTTLLNYPGGAIQNPNEGLPFVELFLRETNSWDRRTDYRDTAAYHLDLGKIFGDHQLQGMLERWEEKTYTAALRNGLVGDPDTPNNPLATTNQVYERTYVNLNGPVQNIGAENLNLLNNEPNVAMIPSGAPTYNRSYINTLMAALQSKFWKDKLVVTVGDRRDYLYQKASTSVNGPPEDGYTVGFLEVGPAAATHYSAETQTLGAVFHVTSWGSLFYDHSDNFGLPTVSQLTAPNTIAPGPTDKTEDMGAIFSFFGGSLTTRITYYQTVAVNNSASLGTVLQTPINAIWSEELAQGVINATQFAADTVSSNAYNFDDTAQGWEGEVVANLTPNWRLLANVSNNKTNETNVGTANINYVNANLPLWSKGDSVVQTNLVSIDDVLNNTFLAQDGGSLPMTPKYILHLRTDYMFGSGWLKGWFVGGGLRANVGTYLGSTAAIVTQGRPLYAGWNTLVDADLGYAWRIPGGGVLAHGRHTVTAQLNVNNVLDNQKLVALSANYAGQVTNYVFQNPTQWILSVAVDL